MSGHSGEGSELIGRVLAGRIEIKDYVGAGGMGAVFLAHHRTLDKAVAVKVLAPGARVDPLRGERFAREAQAAARFDHPNAVRILDFGEDGKDGLLYLVMEYLEGKNLHQVQSRLGPIVPHKLAELMMQALAALAAAHQQGVIHRDVKPANIMLVRRPDDEGELLDFVKVCDFGLAKIFSLGQVARAESTDHAPGAVVGTPLYMSPEQATGDPADARSDVYAVGVVMYEMLTGRPPFVADSEVQILLKHISEPPAPPSTLRPELDPEIDRIVLWTLEKDREARCQSARDLRRALGDYLRRGTGPTAILTSDLVLGVAPDRAPSPTQPTVSLLSLFEQAEPQPAERAWGETPALELRDSNILPLSPSQAEGASSAEVLPEGAILEFNDESSGLQAQIQELVDAAVEEVPADWNQALDSPAGDSFVDRRRHAAALAERAQYMWKHYGIMDEPYNGPYPFWAKDHRQKVLGPLVLQDLLKVLKAEGTAGQGALVEVSPDRQSWQSGQVFLRLTGQETLYERPGPVPAIKAGALQGTLERTSLTMLFARVAREAPTGRLALWNDEHGVDRRVELHLVRGKPTFVYASELSLELPQLLVEKRLLTSAMLPQFMHLVLKEERPLDEVIGATTGLDIVQYRPMFMKARLAHLFGWKRRGSYAWLTGSLPARLSPFGGSLLQLLPELVYATHGIDELRQALLPYHGVVLERSERFNQGVAEMGLTQSQRAIVARFGKPRTLAASLECEPAEQKVVLSLAYVLLETGLLLRPL